MSGNTQSKLWTIIRHEYLTKVKSKGFILSTILGPLGLLAFIGIMALVTILATENSGKRIGVLDQTGLGIGTEMVNKDKSLFFLEQGSFESLKKKVLEGKSEGFLVIPNNILDKGKAIVYTPGGGGIGFIANIEKELDNIVRLKRLANAGVDPMLIQLFDKEIDVETQKVTEKGEEKDFTEIYAGLGYVFGFVIYIMVLIYGSFVRSGVTEEKVNRIVEVIASSARPYDIMMGKVVGIGAVGLTQVAIWIIFAVIAFLAAGPVVTSLLQPDQMMTNMNPAQMPQSAFEIPQISPWLYAGFLFFFLGGYFIYATLFAAVGSVVDQESDAQQLQWPVMIPIILPMLFISIIISDPDSVVSTILSLIPFFSPILMMVRVAATSVPVWQIALSVILVILTFLGCIWAAARIYRVGILMYGKKVTMKDMIKWTKLAN